MPSETKPESDRLQLILDSAIEAIHQRKSKRYYNDPSHVRRKGSRSLQRQKVIEIDTVTKMSSPFTCSTLLFVSAILTLMVQLHKMELYSLMNHFNRKAVKVYIPSDLDQASRRSLSLNLGGGNCLWQPPVETVPSNIDFHKTAIVGYPSGDKRLIFFQMEALTGWPAQDEWEFDYSGFSNHPFIKTNYPHHEGIWGWGTLADQVVLVIKSMRKSMVEYHNILWDLGFATTWEQAVLKKYNLYSLPPPIDDFLEWRDLRILDEVHWYGWFIDYWMEGGLMRDIFSHKITTPDHWNMLMIPAGYSREELEYDLIVGSNTTVTPSYDPHCANGDISGGCQPIAVFSAEKLRDYSVGPNETAAIATALINNPNMSPYVIDEEAWHCIWTEVIVKGKGAKTVYDRPSSDHDYNFSAEMLTEMIIELNRLINKYSSNEWNSKSTAGRIVSLLTEHRSAVQTELDDVNSGRRKLSENDFLGPNERNRRRLATAHREKRNGTEVKKTRKPNLKRFDGLARQRMALKRGKWKKSRVMAAQKQNRKTQDT